MFLFTKKYGRYLSTIMTVIMILVMFPGSLANADNSVDIDVTNWDSWYVYDHYDVESGGYAESDSRFTELRPYFSIQENQAMNDGSITTIPDLLKTGSWRMVHHLKEHVSLVQVPKTGFTINDIVFMGYGEEPYTDFLIYPETSGGVKSFGYDVYALNIDTHTLSSAGFLLNAGVDGDGYLHGYVLLIGFPSSSSGGSFDGARMYLYKILEKGETSVNGAVSPGVRAEDIHHPENNYSKGAFSNQGSLYNNWLPEMDLAVDGRTIILLDNDGDGVADHVGFRQEGSSSDTATAVIYDSSGSITAQVLVDGTDIIIDSAGVMRFYDNKPFQLTDERVSLMAMPLGLDLNAANTTVNHAEVAIDGLGTFAIDGEKYLLGRDGVYVKSDEISDPGYPENYWVGRPSRGAETSFVPGHSWVSVDGTVYPLDDNAYYLEGNNLYIRDDTGAGQFESLWFGDYKIVSGQVVLNGAPAVPFDPKNMWLDNVSYFGSRLCVLNPATGVISTYVMDGTHNYFTTDTLVELNYERTDAGIEAGVYALDGTQAYFDNGNLYIRKNIHYHYVNLNGTTAFVTDGSQFKLKAGQIVETNGTTVKYENGQLALSGPRYTYAQFYWSNDTYPVAMEVEVTGHEVLEDGIYTLGVNDVTWDGWNLNVPISLYVIDGEDLFIANGTEIYEAGGQLFIFPDGVNVNEPGRVEFYSGGDRPAEIVEVITLDGTNNRINPDGTVHLAPRSDRYSFNCDNLLQVGTLTNPGEFFAPEGQKTSVLHLDVAFNDGSLTINSSVPGGNGATKTAIITFNGSLTFQSDGTYRGFGPYVEYQSHGCSSLTSFRFSNMTMGSVPQHQLIFDLNTDDVDAAPGSIGYLEIDEGALIGALPAGTDPTRPNYNFLGWAKKPYATAPDFDSAVERMGFADLTVYAVWEAKGVEVTFRDGGDEYYEGNYANQGKRYGDNLTGFPAPEPREIGDTGNFEIFVGWYLTAAGDGAPWDFATDAITGDNAPGEQLILYAKWEPVTGDLITLSFDVDGGSGSIEDRTVEEMKPVGTLPSTAAGDAPTRAGYDFMGWSTTSGAATPDFLANATISTNTTVYAVWQEKYTVTLDLADGAFETPLDGVQYADNGVYKLPAEEPTKDGYCFNGWQYNSKDYNPGEVIEDINSNIIVVAQWIPLYTVEVSESYADVTGSGTYEQGDVVTINAGNKGSEWVFLGWEVTGGATVAFEDEYSKKTTFTMPSGDVTVTAKWYQLGADDYDFPVESFEVIFDANGGVPTQPVWVDDGESVTAPTDPTRDGYTFKGWYTTQTGGEPWDFNTPITENMVLYAHWSDNAHPGGETHTVTFDWQDGTAIIPVSVDPGARVTAPTPVPERDGHTFIGWFTAPSGGSEWDFTTEITRDIHLYAHWETVKHTVTFDAKDGLAPQTVLVEHGASTAAPADPTRDDYIFSGWYTAESGGDPWNFATPITGDTVIYAQWEPTGTRTVVFDANGGLTTHTVLVEDGASVAEPADPTREDYVFLGWYTAALGGNLWDFATQITEKTVLYAHWEPTGTHTVVFDANGGLTTHSVLVEDGESVAAPADPTREDYDFLGWYTAALGGNLWDFATQITEKTVLYAHWRSSSAGGGEFSGYTVTFDSQRGSDVAPASSRMNALVEKPGNPTRSGYNFLGWFTEASGGVLWDFDNDVVPGNMTLYAQWRSRGGSSSSSPDTGITGTAGSLTPETVITNQETPETEVSEEVVTEVTAEVTNDENNENTATSPTFEQQQTAPQNITLPEGLNPANLTNMDLNARQGDPNTPGGNNQYAPPVGHSAGNTLALQYDDNGNLVFMEIDEFTGVPLGQWMWDEEAQEWVFIDAMPPLGELGEMPKTGDNETKTWPLLAGLAILSAALILKRPKGLEQ